MPEIKEKAIPPVNVLTGDNKADIRSKIWDYLETHDFAAFPRVPRRRISNFKGSDEVGIKISEMDLFKNAHILRIDPDKPLQEIRFKTLEAGKTLLVPTPKLCNHIVSKITPPADADTLLLRNCGARQGVQEFSSPIELDEKILVDLVIVGCVAVSAKGYRVGKGGGLSDLEYAMMASLGVVKPSVPIVTMVHDCQVVEMPDSLFGPHDVPVDFIVTPTRIIECAKKPKPTGILWSLLTNERLEHVPVLRRIRFRDAKRGVDVRLAGEEAAPTDLEDVLCDAQEVLEDRRRRGMPRRVRSNRQSTGEDGANGAGEDGGARGRGGFYGRRRGYGRNRYGGGMRNRRYNSNRKTSENGSANQDDDEGRGDMRRRQRNSSGEHSHEGEDRPRRSRGRSNRSFYDSIEGSIYVGALPRSLRVSEFKTEVRERKVNPMRVLWRGSSGFAFLNFRSHQDAEDALVALEGLQISDTPLKLEMARSPTGRRSGREGGRGGGRFGRRRRTDDEEEEAGED